MILKNVGSRSTEAEKAEFRAALGLTRPRVPPAEIIEWLAENYPFLADVAEQERNWIWIAADLRGDQNKETREKLKEAGFRFAKRGHPLPSGATGTWANACLKPMPFKRSGDWKSRGAKDGQEKQQTDGGSLESEIAAVLQEVGYV